MDHASLWLDVDGPDIPPPVNTREQLLPFEKLTWENFERLCYRLAHKSGDAEDVRTYGIRGQDQAGIDLYVRTSTGSYETWQCKRYAEISASVISGAVSDFLSGDWAKKSQSLKMAVSCSLNNTKLSDAIKAAQETCARSGISFSAFDQEQLSLELKSFPDLVDDFFGRPWVERFNGPETLGIIAGRKLDRKGRISARGFLRDLYETHFRLVDGGIPASAPAFRGAIKHIAVFDRYVAPNIDVVESLIESTTNSTPEIGSAPISRNRAPNAGQSVTGFRRRDIRTRTTLDQAMSGGDRMLLLGGAGHGKSAALRVLIHAILGNEARYPSIAKKWGRRLPILLPFAFLTRHFSGQPNPSIENALTSWLRSLGAKDHILDLLQIALTDDRLLILVDGFDEWQVREAAVTALTALNTFVHDRKIPIIATSRPLGFERLSDIGADWKRAELLPLSPQQVQEFSAHWFRHFHEVSQSQEPSALHQAVARDSSNFAQELSEDQDLSELGSIPLLLSVLIYLRLSGRVLPHSRFAALDALTKALLEDQPGNRAKSAMQSTDSSELRSRRVLRGIEYIAFIIHSEPNSLTIPTSRASALLSRRFIDTDDLSVVEADDLTDRIVELGKNDFGLLISPEEGHLGFIHRIFQEFLAAKHITGLHRAETMDYASGLSMRRGWHEVTVNLLHLLDRVSEADEIIDVIQRSTPGPLDEPLRKILLASISVSDTNCSRRKARELLLDAISWIELGRWMPLRVALIKEVASGLHSEQVGSLLSERMHRWFPGRTEWLFDAPLHAAQFPTNTTPDDLWIAFHNCESSIDYRRIAEAIARLSDANPHFESKLLEVIKGPSPAEMTACALHSLARGWPNNSSLESIVSNCLKSSTLSIRIVAALIRYSRGDRSQEILSIFTKACQSGSFNWPWEDDIFSSLANGWPRNPELKAEAIRGLREARNHSGRWSHESSAIYLVRGCPGDDDVAQIIVEQLSSDDIDRFGFPIHAVHADLVAGFSRHPIVVPAAEAWLSKNINKSNSPLDIAIVAKLGATPRCISALLEWLRSKNTMPFWIIETLYEMLPGNDHELQTALADYVSDETLAEGAAQFLPRILTDRDDLVARLRRYAERANYHNASVALTELAKLEGSNSQWVEDLISRKLQSDKTGYFWQNTHHLLLKSYPRNPSVRRAAVERLFSSRTSISPYFTAYSDDNEIRPLMDAAFRVLHEDLRVEMCRAIAPLARSGNNAAIRLVEGYSQETNEEARTIAVRSLVRSYQRSQKDTAALTSDLVDELSAPSLLPRDHHHAAIAGLLELGRADLIASHRIEGKQFEFSIYARHGVNWDFVDCLAQQWESLVKHMSDPWGRIRGSDILIPELTKIGLRTSAMQRSTALEEEVASKDELELRSVRALIVLHGKSVHLRDLFLNRLQFFNNRKLVSMRSEDRWAYSAMATYLISSASASLL